VNQWQMGVATLQQLMAAERLNDKLGAFCRKK
jgi:hypothetical protein